MNSNERGFCWREECGRNGKRCVACRAESMMQEAIDNESVNKLDKRRLWPWLAAFAASVALAVWMLCAAGCTSLSDAQRVGSSLCKLSQAMHKNSAENAACDEPAALNDWGTAANLAAAKPDLAALKQALIAHPPIQSFMACPIDVKDPYTHEAE